MSLEGHIERGMVVLDQPLPLPDGTLVRVEAIAPVPPIFGSRPPWMTWSGGKACPRQGHSKSSLAAGPWTSCRMISRRPSPTGGSVFGPKRELCIEQWISKL
jgi:hypothetical protein